MIDEDKHDHDRAHDRDHQPGRPTVAVFRSRAEAREAIAPLHKRHYTHTWLGVESGLHRGSSACRDGVEPRRSGR